MTTTRPTEKQLWFMFGFISSQLGWMLDSDRWAFNDLCLKAAERRLTDPEALKVKEIYDKFDPPKNNPLPEKGPAT